MLSKIIHSRKGRPPSYSDSFLIAESRIQPFSLNAPALPTVSSYPGLFIEAQEPLLDTPSPHLLPHPAQPLQEQVSSSHLALPNPFRRNVSEGQFSTFSIPPSFSSIEKWSTRFLGFGVHLTLVSLFETLFFFLFISKSEDAGLQSMINTYLRGVLSSCETWSPDATAVANDILSTFVNRNQTLALAAQAATDRAAFNHTLFVQAWLYVAGIGSCVLIGTTLAKCAKIRIAWRRVWLENLFMVSLLGLYELTFFKTIIYNYENISVPELDGNIVNQLSSQCGLLTQRITRQ